MTWVRVGRSRNGVSIACGGSRFTASPKRPDWPRKPPSPGHHCWR